MASVISSARNASASSFDVLYHTAETASRLVGTAAKSVDILALKADVMHQRAVVQSQLQVVTMTETELMEAATNHTDLMEDIHVRNYPTRTFNRETFFTDTLTKLRDSL